MKEYDMNDIKCSYCGSPIAKKDNKRYGALWLISGLLLFPILLLISYQTFMPYLSVIIFSIIGMYFLFKKKRYVYYCKKCNVKFPVEKEGN